MKGLNHNKRCLILISDLVLVADIFLFGLVDNFVNLFDIFKSEID